MVRGLSEQAQANPAFRESARATLRLSRLRGRAECEALASLFLEEGSDDARRLLILDLLATAGTPDAQIVMRRLLSLPITRKSSRTFSRFVQRLGFVERPDEATLTFMTGLYAEVREESGSVRAACAYALGASIGRAHVWGLEEAALAASEVLRSDLLVAKTTADKCGLIAALGHAALECDVPVLLRFVVDGDPQVRATAVLALRKLHAPEARVWLLSTVGGADHELAENALSALFEHSLEPEEIVRLAELVLASRTKPALDARILRLLGRHKMTLPIVEDAVQLLMSRIEMPAPHPSERRVLTPSRMALSDESGEFARGQSGGNRGVHSQRPPMSTTPFPRSVFPSSAPEANGARMPSIPPLAPIHDVGLRPSRPPPARTFRSAAEALQSCVRKSSRPPPTSLESSVGMTTTASSTTSENDNGTARSSEFDLESAASEIRPAAPPVHVRSQDSVHAFSRPIIPIAKIR